MNKFITSRHVANWPEFQALMNRLGADIHPYWEYIQITLDVKGVPIITQTHKGLDNKEDSKE